MKKHTSWIFLFHKMDNLTKEQRRKNMQNIRSSGSVAERMFMKELRRQKIYFAKNVKSLVGKPDVVFRRKKIAVFIDSDFWHGNPKLFRMPKTNIDYWRNKICTNINRDKKVNKELKFQGWTILRFWEYDVRRKLDGCISKLMICLEERK